MSTPRLSIVVAVKDATDNLEAIAERVVASEMVEVIYVFAGDPPQNWPAPSRARTISASAASLIPHLWRDGIEHAEGEAVALLSAHCIPDHNWCAAAFAADLHNYVGVGGTITLSTECHPLHRAIFLLRYLRFAPPQTGGAVDDIAADNAVYRRSSLLDHPDLLSQGFWEPSFHRRFKQAGLSLFLDPHMRVNYRGREKGAAFAAQRFAHGFEYGASRSSQKSLLQRLAFVAASPLAPVAIFARLVLRSSRSATYALSLLIALPWLMWFLAAWSLGEALGYVKALTSPGKDAAHD